MNTTTFNIEKFPWKRLGMAAFIFYLLKGLIWLAIPIVMYLTGVAG